MIILHANDTVKPKIAKLSYNPTSSCPTSLKNLFYFETIHKTRQF